MASTARTFMLALASVQALGLATAGCGVSFDSYENGAWEVGYTPDGKLVTFLVGQSRVYDTEARHQLRSTSTRTPLGLSGLPQGSSVTLSPDRTNFAGTTATGAEVYRVDTGAFVAAVNIVGNAAAESAYINSVAVSPGGALIAAQEMFDTGEATVSLWRVADGTRVATASHAPGRESGFWAGTMSFSLDGTLLFGSDNTFDDAFLYAWRTSDGTQVWGTPIPNPEHPRAIRGVTAMALSPDGATLATGGSVIHLWNTSDGARVERFVSTMQPVYYQSLSVSPDGSVVATHFSNATSDPLLFGPDGSITQTWPIIDSGCASAAFSPDGTRIAGACGNWLKIWDAATGELIHKTQATVTIKR